LTLAFELPNGCRLRPLEETDADELSRLAAANRAYLAEWMPWASGGIGPEQQREFLRRAERQLAEDDGFQAAILDDGAIVGTIGFHRIDRANRATSLGYWLAESSQGRGTMTEAVRALTTHAFAVWELKRVEIRAAVGNARSRAIPQRLGFVEEGVLRQSERFTDHYKDVVVYSMLAEDWPT